MQVLLIIDVPSNQEVDFEILLQKFSNVIKEELRVKKYKFILDGEIPKDEDSNTIEIE